MITIDRTASTPIQDQLLEQMRYRIASGQHKVGDTLPSTRVLAEQLGISFHTVRKVYQELEREGLLTAQAGHGYVVKERAPLSKVDRMERGAAAVQELLQRLIGLGLDEGEIEYIFQEQLGLLEGAGHRHKLVAAASSFELAQLYADQLKMVVQQPVEAAAIAALQRHHDADYVFARIPDLREVRTAIPRADVLGLVTYYSPETLERVARLLEGQTLALVTWYADAVPVLMEDLRTLTGFEGQIIAASIDEGARHLTQFVGEAELLLYTPTCRRRLRPLLDAAVQYDVLAPVISAESLKAVRDAIPL